MADETFAYWCVVEQLGHRRLAGMLTEVTVAGAGFLRLDVPELPNHPASTHLLSPSSVYALHPVDEATARAVAKSCRPAPVQRYELPAAPPDGTLEYVRKDLVRLVDMLGSEHNGHQPAEVVLGCSACVGATLVSLINRHGLDDEDAPELATNLRDDDEGPF